VGKTVAGMWELMWPREPIDRLAAVRLRGGAGTQGAWWAQGTWWLLAPEPEDTHG